jgi:hypothetical protein
MSASDNDPRYAEPVKSIEALKAYKGYSKAVSANATLAAILGEALPADSVAKVEVINTSTTVTLYVQFNGTVASATNGAPILPLTSRTIYGMKSIQDNVRLFAASEITVGFVVHVTQQG